MIGLRAHARDAALPAAFGDPAAPSEREVLELVEPHFGAALAAELVYARWKPRTALCAGYELDFAAGGRRFVTLKIHAGDKARALAEAASPSFKVEPARNTTLSLFPFDRELPGLERCFDLRRVARHVDELGVFLPLHMRPGPSKIAVLRYKPERRAVLRLDLKLREHDDAPRTSRTLALRVHPPGIGQAIAARRARFDAAAPRDLAPALVGVEARTGVVLEQWLAVTPFAADAFAHASGAGELLARLHAVHCTEPTPETERESLDEVFAIDAALARRARETEASVPPSRSCWIHGDFHPDQIAVSSGGEGWRLLDLDRLAAGDPLEDLAAWIADHVAECGVEWRAAAEPLLAGYARGGGVRVDERRLALAVARALRRLAAGAIRRLEQGAVARALSLLDRAADIAPVPALVTPMWRAACALAYQTAGGLDSDSIERVDRARTGEVVVTTRAHGARRWFATDAQGARELSPRADAELPLSRALAELERAGRIALLAYRPGRRIVVRFTAAESSILKGYRRGRGDEAAARHRLAGQAARELSTRVPDVLACDAERSCLTLSDLGGRACNLASIAPTRIERFGADLRRFQAFAGPRELPVHDAARELAVLDVLAERVRSLDAAGPRGWGLARASLARRTPSAGDSPNVLAHRDLHDGQLLDLGRELGWIDFDLLCAADAALDPANFVAHLELRALQGQIDAARAAELGQAFFRGCEPARESVFRSRFEFYRSATLLRLALVYHLRPRWSHLCDALIERAARSSDV